MIEWKNYKNNINMINYGVNYRTSCYYRKQNCDDRGNAIKMQIDQ